MKVPKGSRRFKKIRESSRWFNSFKKVQEGSRSFKNVSFYLLTDTTTYRNILWYALKTYGSYQTRQIDK